MEPLVDTVIEDDRWQALGLDALAERAARATMAHLDMTPDGFTLCLMGCDDARIAVLNAEFRDKPVPTNVLSWPSEDLSNGPDGGEPARPLPWDGDDPWSLGDIALAYDTCAQEAQAAGRPLADHVTHLVVHGVLHLLGHDHQNDAEATLMETHEIEILGKLGLPDPYRDRDPA
jgi:probable rRNA maturation factor